MTTLLSEAWQARYADKIKTPEQALATVRSGQRVFIGSGAAEPQALVRALHARQTQLADTEVVHIMTLGIAPYVESLGRGFRANAFFIGENVRAAVADCRADYTPIFLSELPRLIRSRRSRINVALIQVTPPDRYGYVNLGVSVDIVKAAAESADLVIAQVNPRMPRVHGDAFLSVDNIDALVPLEEDLLESHHGEPDEVATRIGQHIADLIEDGSTLQMGIGTIPDAVLACLGDKKDLGVHTEMFAEGVIPLFEKGVINGRRKTLHRGKIVASFVLGTRRLFDWIDDNPAVEFHPTEYTNDPFLIAQHDRMVAINAALEVDLTGQVCADSLGELFYSGIGGQVDFIRGASRSRGGKPIIALPATAAGGRYSRIVAKLKPGAGVVTSRGDVHYVVTEYGVAHLHGKTMRERALALIHVAHPDYRDRLLEEAKQRRLVPRDQVAVRRLGTPELDILYEEFTALTGEPVRIRPVRPTDEDEMRRTFYQLSPRSIHQRFFEQRKFAPDDVRQRVSVDFEQEVALVAEVLDPAGGESVIVAGGSYVADPTTSTAEVAFVVVDEWQNRWIGRHLLGRLIDVGRRRGVTAFTAEVLTDNGAMLHLFHRCAPSPVESRLDGDVYRIRFSLDEELRY